MVVAVTSLYIVGDGGGELKEEIQKSTSSK